MLFRSEAAAQGHAYAQYNLGPMYELGHGTRQDVVEARAWYRRAANADLDVARAALDRLDGRPLPALAAPSVTQVPPAP